MAVVCFPSRHPAMPFICLYLQVNTNVQEAGVNEYFLTLEDALSVNHIVVFLTGQIPFSEGFGGSIYLGWPAEGGGVSWQLLGFISNSKPSAIFKITKVTSQNPCCMSPNLWRRASSLSSIVNLPHCCSLLGLELNKYLSGFLRQYIIINCFLV